MDENRTPPVAAQGDDVIAEVMAWCDWLLTLIDEGGEG